MQFNESAYNHYLANLITVLNFEIEDCSIADKQKISLQKLLKTINLLVQFNKLFQGKFALFKTEFSILESLELALAICEFDYQINIESTSESFTIQNDKNAIRTALTLLLEILNQQTKILAITSDPASKEIKIAFEPKAHLNPTFFSATEDYQALFSKENSTQLSIEKQISLLLFKECDIPVKIKDNLVVLQLQ